MKVLLIGEEIRRIELSKCLPEGTEITQADLAYEIAADDFEKFDVVFDLNADEDPTIIDELFPFDSDTKLVVSSVKTQLATLGGDAGEEISLFGLNCLPSFIDRPLKEVSVFNESDVPKLRALMEALQWDYQLVNDRVGMVTPRVIFMIINEACYTVQEGTASMQDIDKSMKLGTAYPYGPFEWADKIGVKDVYETLEAIYHDTGDERYKICPLLKTHYLKDKNFLS